MLAGKNAISLSVHWCTPKKYADAVLHFFGRIDLDPCSNGSSIVQASIKYALPIDGLKMPWSGRVFVNPPYGRDARRKTSIRDWLAKCSGSHCEVVALVPVATNTVHWKKYVFPTAAAICFLYDTRLKFRINGNEDNRGAPMSCCLIYYGTRKEEFCREFSSFGFPVILHEAGNT